MIAFVCPACNRKLSVKDEYAGKRGACPHCKKAVLVPAVSAALTSAPPDAATLVSADDTPSAGDVGAARLDFLSPPQKPGELGRLGSYRVVKILGAGGMGVVLLAEDPVLKRLVALKVMRKELAAKKTSRQRFLREAQATAALDHHHIVHIHQVGEANGVPFIVMPLLKGEPLDSRLKREKRLPVTDAARIARQIAEGLAVAHKHGLIHRDIKPANIWLEEESGWVKIVDFGLARAASNDDVQLTKEGAIIGTPAFMAPEQARSENVDFRCDLFSLGAVLYKMLTGQAPFKGQDTMSLLMSLASDNPQPVESLNPDVPPELADLVKQLLAKDPAQRPPSAKVVAEALAEIMGDPSVMLSATGSRVTPPTKTRAGLWPWTPRSVRAFAVPGVILVALLLTISLPFLLRKQDTTPARDERPETTGPVVHSPPRKEFNSLGMEFVHIPSGKFLMGSTREELDRCFQVVGDGWEKIRLAAEGPQHEVEITQPFFLGTTEVTVGQFRRFVEETKYSVGDERWKSPGAQPSDDCPVVWVSWNNAIDFCEWLSKKENKKYRLPTEAEWEYSCRAGKAGTRYCFGDDDAELAKYAWYKANSEGKMHPVGSRKENAWGVHDMHGNVWEWCQDIYDPVYYAASPKKDPLGPSAGTDRAIRGGSWDLMPVDCRSAFRHPHAPGERGYHIGFRILMLSSPGASRP